MTRDGEREGRREGGKEGGNEDKGGKYKSSKNLEHVLTQAIA